MNTRSCIVLPFFAYFALHRSVNFKHRNVNCHSYAAGALIAITNVNLQFCPRRRFSSLKCFLPLCFTNSVTTELNVASNIMKLCPHTRSYPTQSRKSSTRLMKERSSSSMARSTVTLILFSEMGLLPNSVLTHLSEKDFT